MSNEPNRSAIGMDFLPPGSGDAKTDCDLNNRGCLVLAMRRAFPLPMSGAFKDLLAAIDDAERVAAIKGP